MTKTVLVVEDNDLNMMLFTELLEMEGHRVLQATDGARGLAMAREHRPDLILMDVHLPEISGLDVTRRLKADAGLRHIPIVVLTGFTTDSDRQQALQAGCSGFLGKPVSLPVFQKTVKQFIGRSAAAA